MANSTMMKTNAGADSDFPEDRRAHVALLDPGVAVSLEIAIAKDCLQNLKKNQ